MPRPLTLLLLVSLLQTTPTPALDFQSLTHAVHRYTVIRVDRHDTLHLFNRDASGAPFRRLDRLAASLTTRHQRVLFAMNAGMFMENLAPLGLFVAEGRTLRPLNTRRGFGNFYLKPNGVFLDTPDCFHVIDSTEYPGLKAPVRLATQSGPLLLRNGVLNASFAGGSTQYFRNGVGIPSPDAALFVISEDAVTLQEFALFFRDTLHCPDALYLRKL